MNSRRRFFRKSENARHDEQVCFFFLFPLCILLVMTAGLVSSAIATRQPASEHAVVDLPNTKLLHAGNNTNTTTTTLLRLRRDLLTLWHCRTRKIHFSAKVITRQYALPDCSANWPHFGCRRPGPLSPRPRSLRKPPRPTYPLARYNGQRSRIFRLPNQRKRLPV